MKEKYVLIGGTLLLVFIVGLVYLARLDATTPSNSESKFISYAEQIGLDVEQFKTDIAGAELDALVNADIAEGNALNVTSTPTFFVNGERMQIPNTAAGIQGVINPILADATAEQTIPSGVHYKGSDTPKVIITEYSDLECPACASYFPGLKEYFDGEPEDVSLVYKHFPLVGIHRYAQAAAKATEAAAKQGKFWEMHDIIFENQNEWSR